MEKLKALLKRNAAATALAKWLRVVALALWCHGHDLYRSLAHGNWSVRHADPYWRRSAELFFQYHKLEKGLCIGGPPRFFGADPVRATTRLMREWEAAGLSLDDTVYLGARETLRAYRARLALTPPPEAQRDALLTMIDERLADAPPHDGLATPRIDRPVSTLTQEALFTLYDARRSVREFSDRPVPMEVVREAARMAQSAPSACNRQPTRVHLYADREQMNALLALQNGNKGFGHEIPLLAVVTADASGFFDATERLEGHLDGGLFLMSFLLALQAGGLSSCCLNWCVTPDKDRRARVVGGIPGDETILTYLAIGYGAEGARVPRSPRRAIDTVVVEH